MRLAKVDTEIAGLIKKAQQDKDVLAIIIFGSRARDDAGPTSDLDVCIVLQPKDYDDLKLSRKRLEYLKGVSIPDLDMQIYQQLPLYIRKRILKEGKTLFCRDEDVLYKVAFRTIQEFEDFRRIYCGYLEEVGRG